MYCLRKRRRIELPDVQEAPPQHKPDQIASLIPRYRLCSGIHLHYVHKGCRKRYEKEMAPWLQNRGVKIMYFLCTTIYPERELGHRR
jgi:hypothetical protein